MMKILLILALFYPGELPEIHVENHDSHLSCQTSWNKHVQETENNFRVSCINAETLEEGLSFAKVGIAKK
jgi:hypothetical protein